MFALGVVGFIRGRWVHSGSHWESLGSTRVVGFIRCRWFQSGSARGSLSSSGVIAFTLVCRRVRWLLSGSPLWSFGLSGFFGFAGFAIGVVGFIQDRLDHSGSPLGQLVSSGVFGFNRVRSWVRCVHPRTLVSLAFALDSSEAVGFSRVRPSVGRLVHPGSLG